MQQLIYELEKGEADWFELTEKISERLKSEIFGKLGGNVLKDYRETFEDFRQNRLRDLRNEFIQNTNIENVDDTANKYAGAINKINRLVQDHINYNLGIYINENQKSLANTCPNTIVLVNSILEEETDSHAKLRLSSIFSEVVLGSSTQSGKANAGVAGEEIFGAMCEAVDLRDGEHFKTQHKSDTYSDTDFVFPYVDDYADQDVQIFVAVQFSSNDRLRLVSGELKPGANAFSVTFNGVDGSSKGLKDIGEKILGGMKEKNQKLVCYKKELERFKEKLRDDSGKRKKDGSRTKSSLKSKSKLDFYSDYGSSYSEFMTMLVSRFR